SRARTRPMSQDTGPSALGPIRSSGAPGLGPSAVAAALFVGPQLVRADHAGVEQAGLVQGRRLLGDVPLLRLPRVVGGLLGVVALVGGVRVGLLRVAVGVLLPGVLLVLLVAAVGVGLLGLLGAVVLLLVLLGVGGLLVLLRVRRLGLGLLRRVVRLGRLPVRAGRGVGERREVGEVVGVAGVLDGREVVGEGAEIIGGDPAVQFLPAPADGLQGLGEDRLEGAQLDVDVGVGVAAQGLGVVAALGGVLVLVALLVEAGAGAEQLLASPADGAEGLGQDDLEVGQLGVDVVVGLGADLLGLLAGLGEDPVGLGLGAAGDLGAGDQGAALGVRGLDDPLGLLAGLLDHLLPAADQLLCLGEGVGQRRAHL